MPLWTFIYIFFPSNFLSHNWITESWIKKRFEFDTFQWKSISSLRKCYCHGNIFPNASSSSLLLTLLKLLHMGTKLSPFGNSGICSSQRSLLEKLTTFLVKRVFFQSITLEKHHYSFHFLNPEILLSVVLFCFINYSFSCVKHFWLIEIPHQSGHCHYH